jgi:hypothetical protein
MGLWDLVLSSWSLVFGSGLWSLGFGSWYLALLINISNLDFANRDYSSHAKD